MRGSLRRQIVVSLGVVGLTPLLILLAITFPLTRHHIRERTARDLLDRADVLGMGVGLVLDEAVGDVVQLAAQPTVRRALDSSQTLESALDQLVQSLNQSEGRFLSFHVLDSERELRGSVGESVISSGTDPSFATIASEEGPVVGEMLQGASHSFVVPFAVPLTDDSHRCCGYLVATYDAYRVLAPAASLHFGSHGMAALLTRSGRLIHSHDSIQESAASAEFLEEHRPSAVRHFEGALYADQGQAYVASVAPIESRGSYPWTHSRSVPFSVVVAEPRADVTARADQLNRIILTTGAVMIGLLCVAAALLSRRVSRPIRALIDRVRRFSADPQYEPVPSPGSGPTPAGKTRNELTILGDTFDAMSRRVESQQAELRSHNEEMTQLVEKLRKADALKDEFLSFLSHEVRTPLSAIRSFAELIRITPDLEATERTEFLSIIESECERLTRLSNDLLDLAKIDSGTMPWREELLEMREFLAAVLKPLQVLAARGQVHLMLREDPDLPVLYADRDRLVQLVTNLVSNALKFTPQGGQVIVSATADEGEQGPALRLSVQDTGNGIPEEFLERIFDRYVRTPSAEQAKMAGTGLGLSICKKIVSHYQGEIYAENNDPGMGATFHVVLPCHAHEATDSNTNDVVAEEVAGELS